MTTSFLRAPETHKQKLNSQSHQPWSQTLIWPRSKKRKKRLILSKFLSKSPLHFYLFLQSSWGIRNVSRVRPYGPPGNLQPSWEEKRFGNRDHSQWRSYSATIPGRGIERPGTGWSWRPGGYRWQPRGWCCDYSKADCANWKEYWKEEEERIAITILIARTRS